MFADRMNLIWLGPAEGAVMHGPELGQGPVINPPPLFAGGAFFVLRMIIGKG